MRVYPNMFPTSNLASLALCDDEQTGGDVTHLETRQKRFSTEGDTKKMHSTFNYELKSKGKIFSTINSQCNVGRFGIYMSGC